jgi:hypothetical protein
MPSEKIPIVCTLSADQLAQRREHVIKELFQKTLERRELQDGFEFVFPSSEAVLAEVVEFVAFERKCCRFLSFEVAFEPGEGPIHLRLLGCEDAKDVIRQIFA